MATRKKTPTFEENLSQLETLVADLESGKLSLEDSLKAFEQGVQITRHCQSALRDAEQKVQVLTRNPEGATTLEPFDPAEE